MAARVLGLDIGGANLKAAHSTGVARSRPFALWKQPGRLAAELAEMLAAMPRHDLLAVTMTGELCDCFPTRAEGVRAIVDAVRSAAGGSAVRFWTNLGHFVTASAACETPLAVASANWLALATFTGRLLPAGPGLLIDLGSTTTDLVPLHHGVPRPQGRTDLERMLAGELVYVGAERTPPFAVAATIPFRRRSLRLAPELFATMRDVYLILGQMSPDPGDTATADGRAATVQCARARLARHLGTDPDMLSPCEIDDLCRHLREAHIGLLAEAISAFRQAKSPPPATVRAGAGEFLVRSALQRLEWTGTSVSLAEQLGAAVSAAAPAYAMAVLAAERC